MGTGVGEGEARGQSWRGRIKGVEGWWGWRGEGLLYRTGGFGGGGGAVR